MYQGKFYKETGIPHLFASEDGCILTDNYKQKLGNERILKQFDNGHGYLQISYNYKKHRVNILVCSAWHDNPENKPCVDHIDGDRKNNFKDNLRWVTYKENNSNPITLQRMSEARKGEKNPLSKQVVQLTLNGDYIKTWNYMTNIQRELGYSQGYVSLCCNGKCKQAYGYKWMFLEDYQKLN